MRHLAALVCTASLAAFCHVAHADSALDEPATRKVRDPDVARGLVTAAGATALVLTTTGIMLGTDDPGGRAVVNVGVGAAIVAPSLGHAYSGEYLHALGTTALRGAAWYGLVAGADHIDDEGARTSARVVCGLALAALVVYDVVDAPRAAERRNARASVVIAPAALPTDDGPAWGLAASGDF